MVSVLSTAASPRCGAAHICVSLYICPNMWTSRVDVGFLAVKTTHSGTEAESSA